MLKSILIIAMPVALLFLCYSCEKWKYEECKKVGHGTLWPPEIRNLTNSGAVAV